MRFAASHFVQVRRLLCSAAVDQLEERAALDEADRLVRRPRFRIWSHIARGHDYPPGSRFRRHDPMQFTHRIETDGGAGMMYISDHNLLTRFPKYQARTIAGFAGPSLFD